MPICNTICSKRKEEKKRDESESRRPVVFKVPNNREEDSI